MKKLYFIIGFTGFILWHLLTGCSKQPNEKCGIVYSITEVWTDSSNHPGHMISIDTTNTDHLCGEEYYHVATTAPAWVRICATEESPAFWDHYYEKVN